MTPERRADIVQRRDIGWPTVPTWEDVSDLLEALEDAERQRDSAFIANSAAFAALALAETPVTRLP